jgi:hypothetical protein
MIHEKYDSATGMMRGQADEAALHRRISAIRLGGSARLSVIAPALCAA